LKRSLVSANRSRRGPSDAISSGHRDPLQRDVRTWSPGGGFAVTEQEPRAPERRTPGPGDLGRRVAARRLELGLSPEELAGRTGIAPVYLEHLESGPASCTTNTVVRLASALNTTPSALLGGEVDRAPGPGPATAHATLDTLSDEDAWDRLATGGVGRVVFQASQRGPVALPVNFRVLDGAIVFRTAPETALDAAAGQDPVSFEVDQIDEAMSQGWSVLVTGRLEKVADAAELRRLMRSSSKPWAGGKRDVVLRLVASKVSGRRIRSPW
jgi:nitroimidazol reductase NimA-like FMN-containing flavoprotein (pyridoxamine 5'-phosphate oxidase superfamily)